MDFNPQPCSLRADSATRPRSWQVESLRCASLHSNLSVFPPFLSEQSFKDNSFSLSIFLTQTASTCWVHFLYYSCVFTMETKHLKLSNCSVLRTFPSSYERNKQTKNLILHSAHPICVMASLFSQFVVHIAILSPLARMLMTAPQTSSLWSSKASPTRHKSCKHREARSHPFFTFNEWFDWKQPLGEQRNQ